MSKNEGTPVIPKQIVVYNYYGKAVYFDGRLAYYFQINHHFSTDGWDHLCGLFGISFEKRSVNWVDWPGQKGNRNAIFSPPNDLKVVEEHFAELEVERRKNRIEQLKEELIRLESEEINRVEG